MQLLFAEPLRTLCERLGATQPDLSGWEARPQRRRRRRTKQSEETLPVSAARTLIIDVLDRAPKGLESGSIKPTTPGLLTSLLAQSNSNQSAKAVCFALVAIDDVARSAVFPGLADTSRGSREVKNALRRALKTQELHKDAAIMEAGWAYLEQLGCAESSDARPALSEDRPTS